MASRAALAYQDDRQVTRDEVHYRARATGPNGKPFSMLIVNISAMGLMARCELPFEPGDVVEITLPVIGQTRAHVRWSLGGRIGCELPQVIDLADYYELLAVLLKSR